MELSPRFESALTMAAQCIGLPPSGSRSHRPDGPKTGHALTFTLDHSMGANHHRPTEAEWYFPPQPWEGDAAHDLAS